MNSRANAIHRNACRLGLAAVLLACLHAPASAEIVLSQVIVDLQAGEPAHEDIEVWNAGPERAYVVAEPAEIRSPGLPGETRVSDPNPEVTGLLVSPQRLVLEPDQRRIVRVAAVAPRGETDRVYRVTIKPVAGEVSSDDNALKVLLGYDVLVLYRAQEEKGSLSASRAPGKLRLTNQSNTAQELFGGSQCNPAGTECEELPSTRLYPGASWELDLKYDTPVEFQVSTGKKARRIEF